MICGIVSIFRLFDKKDGGPAILPRIGLVEMDVLFKFYKFRSMRVDVGNQEGFDESEPMQGGMFKIENDPRDKDRVTPIEKDEFR